jgi:Leucine-rich repeat (LRR) protein
LPDALGQLTALRELHLRNTRIAYLPETIASLVDLRQIDLRGTPLKSPPRVLATLPRLEKVDLRWVNTLDREEWFADLEARGCLVYR